MFFILNDVTNLIYFHLSFKTKSSKNCGRNLLFEIFIRKVNKNLNSKLDSEKLNKRLSTECL